MRRSQAGSNLRMSVRQVMLVCKVCVSQWQSNACRQEFLVNYTILWQIDNVHDESSTAAESIFISCSFAACSVLYRFF